MFTDTTLTSSEIWHWPKEHAGVTAGKELYSLFRFTEYQLRYHTAKGMMPQATDTQIQQYIEKNSVMNEFVGQMGAKALELEINYSTAGKFMMGEGKILVTPNGDSDFPANGQFSEAFALAMDFISKGQMAFNNNAAIPVGYIRDYPEKPPSLVWAETFANYPSIGLFRQSGVNPKRYFSPIVGGSVPKVTLFEELLAKSKYTFTPSQPIPYGLYTKGMVEAGRIAQYGPPRSTYLQWAAAK